jgi:hypothetical protein
LVAARSYSLEVLDAYWENLVLGLIGEMIDENDDICGCRIVDQTRNKKVTYKIEVWLRNKEDSVAIKLKARLSDILTDGEATKAGSKVRAPEFDHSLRS